MVPRFGDKKSIDTVLHMIHYFPISRPSKAQWERPPPERPAPATARLVRRREGRVRRQQRWGKQSSHSAEPGMQTGQNMNELLEQRHVPKSKPSFPTAGPADVRLQRRDYHGHQHADALRPRRLPHPRPLAHGRRRRLAEPTGGGSGGGSSHPTTTATDSEGSPKAVVSIMPSSRYSQDLLTINVHTFEIVNGIRYHVP